MKAFQILGAVILVGLTSCNIIGGSGYQSSTEITLNSTEFSASASESIFYTLKNISDGDLYIPYPAPDGLQVKEGDAWVMIGPWYIYPAIAPSLRVFPSGEQRTNGLKSDDYILEVGKTYRFVIALYHSNSWDGLVHISERSSKEFTIVP